MKKTFHLFFLILVAFACSGKKANDFVYENSSVSEKTTTSSKANRYGIKSGYFVVHNSMFEDMAITTYFDNYGAIEMIHTTMDMGMVKYEEFEIHRDGYSYKFKQGEESGTRMKWFPASAANYDAISSSDAKRYKYKEVGKEKILGRECNKFTMEIANTPMTGWVWKGIALKTMTQTMGQEFVLEVKELEEMDIPSEKFELPSGIIFNDI